MKVILTLFVIAVASSYAYSIWPQPQEFTRGSIALTLSSSTLVVTTTSSSDILAAAIQRLHVNAFPYPTDELAPNMLPLKELVIEVLTTDETLQFGVNENYTLSLNESGAVITAPTVFGAMHGMESFMQLIDFNLTTNTYSIQDTPIEIVDYPRFPWRGVMIDTSRHYLQVQTILTMIDAVSYNKMNTLHWHVTDSQSFPMQSTNYPYLAISAAYQYPEATYSHENVSTIVQYAYERGVRVVPEFDVPGHSFTWGLYYPNITVECNAPDGWGYSATTLDPTSPAMYKLLAGFVGEMKNLFIDDFFHFGGDEVDYGCWNVTPRVIQWMKEHNVSSFAHLEQLFEDNLQTITNDLQIYNRVLWEDSIVENNISYSVKTTTFEVWRSKEVLFNITAMGFKTILASGNYLDMQQPGPSVHYEWVDTWQDFYDNEPTSPNMNAEQMSLVLGAEAVMFGEGTDDENIFSRVWVRASGTAERLWSPLGFTANALSGTNFDDTQSRIVEFRCRLKLRGIQATAIRPDYCPLPSYLH